MFSRLILPITYDCNLNCKYCYMEKRGSEALPLLVGKKAIDFLIENNRGGKADLIFTGGEPLLEWEKIKTLILYAQNLAKKAKIDWQTIGLATNGLLLNQKILAFCRNKNIEVAVSADGFENKRGLRKGGNSFLLLEKKFPLLLKYKDIVRIKLTIHPEYANKLFYNFKNFYKIGFDKIDIQPARGISWLAKQRQTYWRNLSQCLRVASRARQDGKKIDMKYRRDISAQRRLPKYCPKVRAEFLVDIDGRVYPCSFFLSLPPAQKKKYAIGHISRGVNFKLAENFKNHLVCEARNSLPLIKKKCPACRISSACFKICLGFDIQKKQFNQALAEEAWQLLRGIERLYLRSRL